MTKQGRMKKRLERRPEKLPAGLRGMEAIRALPDEDVLANRRRPSLLWARTRQGMRLEGTPGGDEEDNRVVKLERAFLDGRLVHGWEGTVEAMMRIVGMKSQGCMMAIQLNLAIRRSPLLIRTNGPQRYMIVQRGL